MPKCIVCLRPYEIKKSHQVVCSLLCKKALGVARVNIRRLRERGIKDDGRLPRKKCTVCKRPFTQRQSNYVTCGRKECVRLRNIRTNAIWRREWGGKV